MLERGKMDRDVVEIVGIDSLERLTKPKSNQSSSKGEEGQMDISPKRSGQSQILCKLHLGCE